MATGLTLLCTVGCGGTTLIPTTPSPTIASLAPPAAAPPSAAAATEQVITGSVGPLRNGTPPCYLERYSCEVYGFSMRQAGAVEVTLTWPGHERAMLIQLYETGSRLVHEDLARRGGPPVISFRRPDLDAGPYELRVVNLEPGNTIPFTLTLMKWD